MSNDENEPTKEELEQRVDQLEETVQKMMPNRRQTIKGLGLLGGGALLGGVGSQEAKSATGSAGRVGQSTDRPDVFADTVDSNSVSTEELDSKIETPANISSNRQLDTVYQNTSGHLISVVVIFKVNTAGDTYDLFLRQGASQSLRNNNNVDRKFREADTDFDRVVLRTIVPDGQYYEVVQGGANDASVVTWQEIGWTS